MKKILIPSLVAGLLAATALSAPIAKVEKEPKSTTPVVAAVSAEYDRQMAPERASRERVRAAVDEHRAKQAKIAKAKALAKKKAIAKQKAIALAKKKERARLAAIAAQKAAEKKAAERKKALATRTQQTYTKPAKTYSGGSAKAYALSRVGSTQFACLDLLWMRESGWNPSAMNPSSGAYGIPQALPGSKMATAGADWQTNPITQVNWGLGYIANRYGTPCGAWAHSQSVGWY